MTNPYWEPRPKVPYQLIHAFEAWAALRPWLGKKPDMMVRNLLAVIATANANGHRVELVIDGKPYTAESSRTPWKPLETPPEAVTS